MTLQFVLTPMAEELFSMSVIDADAGDIVLWEARPLGRDKCLAIFDAIKKQAGTMVVLDEYPRPMIEKFLGVGASAATDV